MMETTLRKVDLPQDIVDYVQRLFYEFTGYQGLLRSILSVSGYVYQKDLYQDYMNRFNQAHKEYQLCLSELEGSYGKDLVEQYGEVNMHINFYANTLTFTIKNDKGGCCSCE